MKASLIMPVHNQLEYTKQAVSSIYENAGVPFEIIIINNGSTDNTHSFFNKAILGYEIKYVKNSKNQTFSKSINQGLKCISDDCTHIGILNNDILVYKDWLKLLINHLTDKIRLIAPLQAHGPLERKCIESIYNIRGKYHIKYSGLMDVEKNWSLEVINKHLSGLYLGKSVKLVKALGFYSAIMEKRTFDEIGFLDDNFINGGEDDDYCRRLELKNYAFHCALDVCIRHFGSKTINATRWKESRWNVELLSRKHPDFYKRQGYKGNVNIKPPSTEYKGS